MKTILFLTFAFCLFTFNFALAQIPTCAAAIKATPPGPFPCSVTATWVNTDTQPGGTISLERRLNAGPWVAISATLVPSTTSAIDTTLQQSATTANIYDYRIMTTNSAGSAQSVNPAIASFTIPQGATVPKPATSLTITFQGATGQIKLTGKNTINLKNQDGTMTLTGAVSVVDIQ